jgi:hypothetical protein
MEFYESDATAQMLIDVCRNDYIVHRNCCRQVSSVLLLELKLRQANHHEPLGDGL